MSEDNSDLKSLRQSGNFPDTCPKKIAASLYLTDEQKCDFRKAFNLLDYNGVGKINSDEFRVAIKALGFEPSKVELKQMVDEVDRSKCGRLSYEEFATAMMRKVAAKDADEDLMKSFRLMDVDDSGFISYKNMKEITGTLGIDLTDEEIFEMLDEADADKDGQVGKEDFFQMMYRCVPLRTP